MGCVLERSGKNKTDCSGKVASGRRVAGANRTLVNVRRLQLECARALHELLLVPVLTHGSDTMIWKEKERPRIWAVQIDKFRALLGIRRMDEVPKPRIRQLLVLMVQEVRKWRR